MTRRAQVMTLRIAAIGVAPSLYAYTPIHAFSSLFNVLEQGKQAMQDVGAVLRAAFANAKSQANQGS